MNAWKSHGRGTVVLRMSFRNVGRIERATGFRDPAMLPRLKEMLTVLHEAGKDDILRDLKHGRLTLRQLWGVYRSGDWRKLPTAAHALPFAETWEAWADGKPQASYRRFCARVRKALGEIPTLGALRDKMLRYRTKCETAGKGAMFNRSHSRMLAFLRDTLTEDHVLHSDIAAIAALTEHPKRPGHAQAPEDAAHIATMLGGEQGRIWWVLCCHGLMPDEFFGAKWRIEDGRLFIAGTKTVTRPRTVPLFTEMFTPVLSQRGFEKAMYRAKLGVTPYDGRRSYGLWCDLVGLPEGWKKALLGHSQDTTNLYGWRESERMLGETEPKIRALIAPYLGVLQPGGQSAGHGA